MVVLKGQVVSEVVRIDPPGTTEIDALSIDNLIVCQHCQRSSHSASRADEN